MYYALPESVKIKKVGLKWKFSSEVDLEDFLYSYLNNLLGLTPLKRQFPVSNQFCDILAIDTDKSLTIIELKNEEDRYVISQISRYYDALLENKPLNDLIDYSKSIRALVISPTFHRDNFIDRKYSRLDIDFLQFNLSLESSHLNFSLKNIDKNQVISIDILHEDKSQQNIIPDPSRRLLNLLSDLGDIERKAVLNARAKILGFHHQIKEISLSSSILYCSSKNKACAELRYDESRKTIALFLWLPHITSRSTNAKKIVARMRIWTDWRFVTALGHVPKGNGRMISFEEWKTGSVRPLNKLLPPNSWGDSSERYFTDKTYREQFVERNKYLALNPHYTSGLAMPIEKYLAQINREGKILSLQDLINLALETWTEKI